jgi:uncharacterized protein (DUF983 family)
VTKFLAYVALLILSQVNMVANMWYTYSMWPQNWLSFVFFGTITTSIIYLMLDNVKKES